MPILQLPNVYWRLLSSSLFQKGEICQKSVSGPHKKKVINYVIKVN